jgi:hypothetical protein
MGSKTTVPPPPPISGEEKALLAEQTKQLQTISGIMGQQQAQQTETQNLYKQLSGLYDTGPGGELTLNQDKVTQLQQDQEQFGALSNEISQLQSDRYLKALKGELPVSVGTQQRKEDEFRVLQENLARGGGGMLTGGSPESAVGTSSAAIQSLGEFNRTYKLVEDAERRGELAGGGMGAAPGSFSLGSLSQSHNYSPGNLVQGYGALASGFGQAAQPYANLRLQQYDVGVQNAALASQQQAAQYGLVGQAAGMGATAMILCFDPETRMEMKDGEIRQMKSIVLGDVLKDGGEVTSIRDAVVGDGTFFIYDGVKVTGSHAVKEDGVWIRVRDSKRSLPVADGGLIRCLGTTTHRLFIEGIEFADEFETDLFGQITPEQSLEIMNKEAVHG